MRTDRFWWKSRSQKDFHFASSLYLSNTARSRIRFEVRDDSSLSLSLFCFAPSSVSFASPFSSPFSSISFFLFLISSSFSFFFEFIFALECRASKCSEEIMAP